MANKNSKKVLLLIRDYDEDEFLVELWKNLSTLRETYLRHVYSRRNRKNKKTNRNANDLIKPTAVSQPKSLPVISKQNFSDNGLSCISEIQLKVTNGGNVVGVNKPVAPVDNIISVEKPTSDPVFSQPKLNATPVVLDHGSKPSVVVFPLKVPSPPKASNPPVATIIPKDPSPPQVPNSVPGSVWSPPLVDCPVLGQPIVPPKIVILPSPVEVQRDKVKRSWSSLVVQNPTTKIMTQRVNSETVSRVSSPPPVVDCPIPNPPVSKPTRHEKKIHDDPVRLRWIERRKRLIDAGADLSAVGAGREDLETWPDPSFKDKNRGTKNLYVVWCGRKVGVFCGWDLTKSLVSGFGGAGYRKVASDAEAFQILEEKLLH